MPTLNGIEAARQISANVPHTAIVFLSMHSDEGYVLKALKSGAKAYLPERLGRVRPDQCHPRC